MDVKYSDKGQSKSIYKVNDISMAYKDLFTVCQYFFIITAQAYFVPMWK